MIQTINLEINLEKDEIKLSDIKKPRTEDEKEFGFNQIIYCQEHLAPHFVGWCTVPNMEKIPLDAKTLEDAVKECRAKGYLLYEDIK